MQLENLDFYEFYKDEYSKIDRGFGIGASGIITPKQMINVINVTDNNKKELYGWAQGGHQQTFYEIIKHIYNLDEDNDWNSTSELARETILNRLVLKMIHIHYINWSSINNKYIIIYLPAYITKSQCDNLLNLNKKIKELSKNYKIRVDLHINGYIFNPIQKEIFKEESFDNNSKNNIIEAIKYLNKHNRIDDEKSKQIYDESLLKKERIFSQSKIVKRDK